MNDKIIKHYSKKVIKKKRPTLTGRAVLGINIVLVCVLGVFIIWDYYSEWSTYIGEKKTSLEEEAKIILTSVLELKESGDNTVQSFIDEVCGAMQESTSPGHHIVVEMASEVFQAKAHNRASPATLSAMKQAMYAEDGIASVDEETIVVGTTEQEDIVVYVSEYLSNIRQIVKSQIIRRIISILLVGLILAVVLNILLHKLIAGPLEGMVGVVQRLSQGELGARMHDVPTIELGLLADEFDQMADALEAADDERRQRMGKARMIQRNLLPDPSLVSDVRLACLFHPAAEVAGDYYDIVRLSDRALLFCIADVIGHDVPAAMSAAMLKALLKTAAEQENDPEKIIHLIHSAFSQVTLEGDFATMTLVRWDPTGQTLTYASAGHETGYLIQLQGEIRELNPTGPILGIQGLSQWSKRELTIQHGDRLVMLTDGITETLSSKGEVFGRARLIQILEQSRSDPLNILSERLMDSITSFRGPAAQVDDIAMLAVEL